MNRNSPYFELKYRVDYTDGRFWETIAAFNSDRVALAYAADCRKAYEGAERRPEWRTMRRTSTGEWVEIMLVGKV